MEALEDPGGLADRVVGAQPGDRLRLAGLQAEIGAPEVHLSAEAGDPGDLLRGLRRPGGTQADHVQVDGLGVRAVVQAQPRGDEAAPVAALGQIGLVAELAGHQGVEDPRRGPLAQRPSGLAREAEARQRRDHEVEGVGRVAAVARGEGQGFDGLPELEMAARPAVGDQQRALALRLADHVDEVDVEVLDRGGELREAVEVGLGGADVEAVGPVGAEGLQKIDVAAIGPAAAFRGGWELIGADLAQDLVDLVAGPVHLERRRHGGLPVLKGGSADFPEGGQAIRVCEKYNRHPALYARDPSVRRRGGENSHAHVSAEPWVPRIKRGMTMLVLRELL